MEPFILQSITIGKQCSKVLRKSLRPGTYKLAQPLPLNLYGANITVCAIVGENGSGKTSLLDILFRVINNFAYVVIGATIKRKAAAHLFYVLGLFAKVEYLIGEKHCEVACVDDNVGISYGQTKYYFSKSGIKQPYFRDSGYTYLNNPLQDIRIEILNHFFYSVVTNYSLQAFNSNEYLDEGATSYVDGKDTIGSVSDASWMDSLFHKNDGYLTPITLNPYRNKGVFDLNRETELTINRLSAILLHSKLKSREFLEGYQLLNIYYTFDEHSIVQKLLRYEKKEDREKGLNLRYIEEFYLILQRGLKDPDNYLYLILSGLGLDVSIYDSVYLNACAYLGYKVLSIAGKYPSYEKFASIGDPWNIFREANEKDQKAIKELISKIKDDHSHITTKFSRTKTFVEAYAHLSDEHRQYVADKFDFTTYENIIIADGIRNRSAEGYTVILPPPIFKPQILFKVSKAKNEDAEISLEKMSSGERQYLYMMSTLVYHIINIKSVPTSREHYRNINIVLDEVEICFHPEYQRRLVYWLVRTLQSLKLNTFCSFNIIMTTHSPFILSDMMSENILYLKRGEPYVDAKITPPFAANVNDILRQSFFLENGFMGELAKQETLSLINYLSHDKQKNRKWDRQKAVEYIRRIGEPLLRQQLENALVDK